ncbi:hypothetical protein vBVhaSVHB1_66 [Vibrio phage vB_VhaS-VHB1]|nr:hypothetical protein vBVhaSVHB1_66 [Vibrio phage vB_VhaS-VHB1]
MKVQMIKPEDLRLYRAYLVLNNMPDFNGEYRVSIGAYCLDDEDQPAVMLLGDEEPYPPEDFTFIKELHNFQANRSITPEDFKALRASGREFELVFTKK